MKEKKALDKEWAVNWRKAIKVHYLSTGEVVTSMISPDSIHGSAQIY